MEVMCRKIKLLRPDRTTREDPFPEGKMNLADPMNGKGDFVAHGRSDPNDRNGEKQPLGDETGATMAQGTRIGTHLSLPDLAGLCKRNS